jgi:hypothetical protein
MTNREILRRLRALVCAVLGHKQTRRQDEERGLVDQCARCEKELTAGEVPDTKEPPDTTALALRELVVVGDQMTWSSRIEVPVVQVRTHAKHIQVRIVTKLRRRNR